MSGAWNNYGQEPPTVCEDCEALSKQLDTEAAEIKRLQADNARLRVLLAETAEVIRVALRDLGQIPK